MLDPTIEVELGAAINAMLQRTGFLDDVHDAISEGLGSFKFVRSFRKVTNNGGRKKSRIKKRSRSKSCFDIHPSSVISEDSIPSSFSTEGNIWWISFKFTGVSFSMNSGPFKLMYFIWFLNLIKDAKNESEVSSVLGGLSSMMLNLSGIDLEEQKLLENSSNKSGTTSTFEIENTESDVVKHISNVGSTSSCDILNSKMDNQVRIIPTIR